MSEQAMRKGRGKRAPYLRYRRFTWVILVAILVVALTLMMLFREWSRRNIVEFGERSNVTVATTAISSLRPELVVLLKTASPAAATAGNSAPRLLRVLDDLVRDTQIARLKIYNAQGTVLYSTRRYEIGAADGDNAHFQNAIAGNSGSKLRLHDAFHIFAGSSEDDNLIETYAPIWLPGHTRPAGVFEIYTDVSPLILAMSHSEVLIFVGVVVIMAGLYAMLVAVIRMADKVISRKQEAIEQRNRTLETVALRTFRTDGKERRRLAFELQEEIAQTLGAVKFRVEALAEEAGPTGARMSAIAKDEIAPILSYSVSNMRNLASRMHPFVLDDFGLAASLRFLCQETQMAEGTREIALVNTVRDEEVPEMLHDVIFRIAQQTLSYLALTPGSKDIQVTLSGNDRIRLAIEFRIDNDRVIGDVDRSTQSHREQIAAYWERTILAGGVYEVGEGRDGGFACQAIWHGIQED